MKVIQVSDLTWDMEFKKTLDLLKLKSLETGEIDVNLNSQMEVSNFIGRLHRQFHYEVCMLKDRLEKA